MTSKEAEIDLDTLLSMEIKLRLLDAEGVGVDIPQDPPPVPADPPNYEFCYDFKWIFLKLYTKRLISYLLVL